MSINLMSSIFQTEFRDLQDEEGQTTKASTAKLVLLAMADNANDEGEGSYPSIESLSKKCALSEQTIRNTFDALLYNGIIFRVGTSKYMTHNHTINTNSFPAAQNKRDFPPLWVGVKPVEGLTGEEGGSNRYLKGVKPVDPNHQLTIKGNGEKTPKPKTDAMPVDWKLSHGLEVTEADVARIEDDKRKDSASLISTGFGILAPVAREIAYAFQVARNITIPEGKIKGQRKAVKDLLDMHVTPENVSEAVRQLTKKGMTVVDLFSISKTAIDLANAPIKQYDPNEEFML